MQPTKKAIVYDLLTDEELDDTLVQTMKAQQMDHRIHTLNAERYEAMLPALEDGPWKQRVTGLLEETRGRIVEVESIIVALEPQLPDATRKAAAVARLSATEAAVKARG